MTEKWYENLFKNPDERMRVENEISQKLKMSGPRITYGYGETAYALQCETGKEQIELLLTRCRAANILPVCHLIGRIRVEVDDRSYDQRLLFLPDIIRNDTEDVVRMVDECLNENLLKQVVFDEQRKWLQSKGMASS